MKISNEAKVGALALLATFILVYGFFFLKGRNLFSKEMTIYAVYERIDGLQVSAPIYVNGLQVGAVTDTKAEVVNDKWTGRVEVALSLNRGSRIPKTAIAKIVQASMMSGMAITIYFDKAEVGVGDLLKNGDHINGVNGGGFIGDALGQVDPVIDKLVLQVNHAFNGLVGKVDSMMAGKMKEVTPEGMGNTILDLKSTVANVNKATGSLNITLDKNQANLTATIANLKAISDNLKDNNQKISDILASVDGLTKKLNNETMGKVHTTIDNLNTTLTSVKGTLSNVDKSLTGVDAILAKVQNGEGTIPMLLNDKGFADELATTIKDVQLLVQDFRLNPKRYIRLFRTKSPDYEKPTNDPGHTD